MTYRVKDFLIRDNQVYFVRKGILFDCSLSEKVPAEFEISEDEFKRTLVGWKLTYIENDSDEYFTDFLDAFITLITFLKINFSSEKSG